METRSRPKTYYTPYTESGRRAIGQIIRNALERSGLSTRKFCEAVCDRAGKPKVLDKTTLTRLIESGREGGSKGGDFWRLQYLASFTYWEEEQRPFTEAELLAIAMGELAVGFSHPKDIESVETDRENSLMEEFKIELSQQELFKLRANIIASASRDGLDPEEWFVAKRMLPLGMFSRLTLFVEELAGGGQPLTVLEQLSRHLYQVQWWQGEGSEVQAIVGADRYPSLEALIRTIKNGRSVLT